MDLIDDHVETAQLRFLRLHGMTIWITAVSADVLAQQHPVSATHMQRLSPSVTFGVNSAPTSGGNLKIR